MLESCALHVIRGESRRESVVMVVSTESGVTQTQNNDFNIFILPLNDKDENQVQEKVQENIGSDNKTATMESNLTCGLGSGKPGYEQPSKASSERYRLFVINAVIGFMA